MPVHPAALDTETLLRRCEVRRRRGSGPGGQHRNKVETAIDLVHVPTGVTGSASERRRQTDNQRVALLRLRVNLALAVRCEAADEPSELWRSRCRGGAIRVNPSHADFPAMLAEALNRLAACVYEPKPAADALGVSSSQLVKFLKAEPRALERVNAEREKHGMHLLR